MSPIGIQRKVRSNRMYSPNWNVNTNLYLVIIKCCYSNRMYVFSCSSFAKSIIYISGAGRHLPDLKSDNMN